MVKVRDNLTGKRFGRLVVLKQAEDYVNPNTGVRTARWLCQCDCGSDPIIITGGRLKDKNILLFLVDVIIKKLIEND